MHASTTTKALETTLTQAIEVPREEWIDYLTKEVDIFMTGYCGYWLRGVEKTKARGWLVWEDDEDHAKGKEPDRKEALRAWRAGEALPAGWYRLDEAAAIKAYHEGIKLWGADWFEPHGDADGYDIAIQMALLGEHRYS